MVPRRVVRNWPLPLFRHSYYSKQVATVLEFALTLCAILADSDIVGLIRNRWTSWEFHRREYRSPLTCCKKAGKRGRNSGHEMSMISQGIDRELTAWSAETFRNFSASSNPITFVLERYRGPTHDSN